MTNEIFYAVQHGDNFDWDNGSDNYDEAVKMAEEMAENSRYDGEEIRIATINVDNSFCEDEEVIREGTR